MAWPPLPTDEGRVWLERVRSLAQGGSVGGEQPWLAWLLVSLCHQRHRQRWHREVERAALDDVEEDEGDVPGHAGWTFAYHGRGLALAGPDGEVIDVDAWGDDGDSIDPMFYAARVLGLRRESPELRLRCWLPTAEWVVEAIAELRRLGLVGHGRSEWVFRMHPDLTALVDDIVAQSSGDWRGVAERIGDDGEDAPMPAAFEAWLRGRLDRRDRRYELLPGARQLLGDAALLPLYLDALAGPIDSGVGRVAQVVGESGLEVDAALLAARDRLDPAVHHPFPATAICRVLLERGVEPESTLEVVLAFSEVRKVKGYLGNPFAEELAMLVLEHAPERAARPVTRALLSNTPVVVRRMSALLSVLDQPWCHRALVDALQSGVHAEAPELRRYLAAGLAASRWPSVQAAAREHEVGPARAAGMGLSYDELVEAHLEPWFASAVERVTPVAERIRARWSEGA